MTNSSTWRVARISIFAALAVVGSFIKTPGSFGPISSVAFDSFAGFFVALYFGAFDGAVVAGLGHLATATISGFPLGYLHLPIALGMALAGASIGLVNSQTRAWTMIPALACGVAINTAFVFVVVPSMGWGAAIAYMPVIFIAAALNALIAALAYTGLRGKFRK